MTDQQPRTPGGVPTGGQFSSHWRDEDSVTLALDDLEYNRTGTFLFPPRARSAGQHVAFWRDVDIDDAVLENISLGYEKWAFDWHQRKQNDWLESEYFPANKIDRFKYRNGEVSEAVRVQIEAAAAAYSKSRLDAEHPQTISAVDARAVARAGQMYFYSGVLSEEDQSEVDSATFIVQGAPQSVAQIVDRYSLTAIRPFFAGATRAIVEGLDQVRVDAALHRL